MKDCVVTIGQGQLLGKLEKNYSGEDFYSFQGIPYAKPPIENLRFKPPEPPDPWSGVLDATKEGPECPSTHSIMPIAVGREDNCLNLNVFTKSLPQERDCLYPVMFWIHGGGFVRGSNKRELHGPEFLLVEDIVLVVINYRVGPLGFLCLNDESLGVPGNVGLRDQILALKWVQENIKAFNGDPHNVTLFAESAGAASVHFLILSQLTRGLFHKAILQSGCAFNPWAEGSRGAAQLCETLGCTETDEKKMLEFLRSIPSKRFSEAIFKTKDAAEAGVKRCYGPVIEKPSDHAVISDTPENIIKSGNYNKVPMIIGCTDMEGYIFELIKRTPPYADYPIKDFSKEIDFRYHFTKDNQTDLCDRIRKFYFGDQETLDDVVKTVTLKTDNMFLYGIHKSLEYHLKYNKAAVYFYVVTLETDLNICKGIYTANWLKLAGLLTVLASKCGDGMVKSILIYLRDMLPSSSQDLKGAAHGDDLMYLFKTCLHHRIQPGSREEIGIKHFVKLWTNFAKTGNPTPQEDVEAIGIEWKRCDENKAYLEIGDSLTIKEHPFKERMAFWDSILSEMTYVPSS